MEPSNIHLRTNAQHPGPVDFTVKTPGADQTQMRNRNVVASVALTTMACGVGLGIAVVSSAITFKAAVIVAAVLPFAILLLLVASRAAMQRPPRWGLGQPTSVSVTRIVHPNPSGAIPVETPGLGVNAGGRSRIPNPRVNLNLGAGVGRGPGHAAWVGAGDTARPEFTHRGGSTRFVPLTPGEPARARPAAGVSPVVVTGTNVVRDPGAVRRGGVPQ